MSLQVISHDPIIYSVIDEAGTIMRQFATDEEAQAYAETDCRTPWHSVEPEGEPAAHGQAPPLGETVTLVPHATPEAAAAAPVLSIVKTAPVRRKAPTPSKKTGAVGGVKPKSRK